MSYNACESPYTYLAILFPLFLQALLELLDQVEDAICVEKPTICNENTNYIKSLDGIADNLPIGVDSAAESTIIHTPKEAVGGSNSNYLVLEVFFFWNCGPLLFVFNKH